MSSPTPDLEPIQTVPDTRIVEADVLHTILFTDGDPYETTLAVLCKDAKKIPLPRVFDSGQVSKLITDSPTPIVFVFGDRFKPYYDAWKEAGVMRVKVLPTTVSSCDAAISVSSDTDTDVDEDVPETPQDDFVNIVTEDDESFYTNFPVRSGYMCVYLLELFRVWKFPHLMMKDVIEESGDTNDDKDGNKKVKSKAEMVNNAINPDNANDLINGIRDMFPYFDEGIEALATSWRASEMEVELRIRGKLTSEIETRIRNHVGVERVRSNVKQFNLPKFITGRDQTRGVAIYANDFLHETRTALIKYVDEYNSFQDMAKETRVGMANPNVPEPKPKIKVMYVWRHKHGGKDKFQYVVDLIIRKGEEESPLAKEVIKRMNKQYTSIRALMPGDNIKDSDMYSVKSYGVTRTKVSQLFRFI